jgi:hypothetical protein
LSVGTEKKEARVRLAGLPAEVRVADLQRCMLSRGRSSTSFLYKATIKLKEHGINLLKMLMETIILRTDLLPCIVINTLSKTLFWHTPAHKNSPYKAQTGNLVTFLKHVYIIYIANKLL